VGHFAIEHMVRTRPSLNCNLLAYPLSFSTENAQLVSSKQLTAFSDFRLPLNAPDHLSLPAYVKYLEAYVAHFKLQSRAERFKLGTKVTQLTRNDKGGHNITWQNQDGSLESDDFTHVSLCTGLHVTPNFPDIPGLPPPGKEADSSKSAVVPQNLTEEQSKIITLHYTKASESCYWGQGRLGWTWPTKQ
jgi:cation diffusion facilitator CzcD-associated flavoprotein CzcO